MKITEIIGSELPKVTPQPSVVAQQQRIGKVVAQIAASDQQREPTEMDKVLAMRRYAKLKKQNNKEYVLRLQQQLADAKASMFPRR